MKEQEHILQVQCVRWFRYQHPNILIFAIPNGGQRNVIVASKMKAEGVTAGIPDLFIAHQANGYGGLFIEMKNGSKGRLSPNQKEIISRLECAGYRCEVVRSFDDFVTTTENYLKHHFKE